MKTLIPRSQRTLTWWAVAAGALLAGWAMAESAPEIEKRKVVITTDGAGNENDAPAPGSRSRRKVIKIESIEPDRGKEPAKEVAWLGVSTEESSEALASQLALKSGQGLVVIYVSPDSPAAKAGLQKFDVLVELGDQLLVHPVQLRKLVQTHKEGDSIKLTLHRGGKKQTVSATLVKRTEELGMMDGNLPGLEFELAEAKIGGPVREHFSPFHESRARAGIDRQTVDAEVQRNMGEVRKAIEEALRHSPHANHPFGPDAKDLEALARGKVDVEKDASVIVKKYGASVKTIVKSDDTGVCVIVANPKKRLTAHDKDGKLLFDGEIESQEQQQKVPAELWERVQPMLQEIEPAEDGKPKPQAQSENNPKI